MDTTTKNNQLVKQNPQNFVDFLVPDEGELSLIYGKIGMGKTYYAVRSILDDLRRGQVVYTTFPLNFEGFDQTKNLFSLLSRKNLFVFPKENLRFLDPYSDDVWEKLYNLDNCKIYFDDCIVHLFDSYEKTLYAKKKRQWAFTTRHYDRSIILITQRPNQVQVALRSQVNRFFKCERVWRKPLFFKVKEYQDMIGESVDESKDPEATERFFASRSVLEAYDTKYLRQTQSATGPLFEVYRASIAWRLRSAFVMVMAPFLNFLLKQKIKKNLKKLKIPIMSDRASRGVKLKRVTLKDRWQGGPEQTSIGRESGGDINHTLPF